MRSLLFLSLQVFSGSSNEMRISGKRKAFNLIRVITVYLPQAGQWCSTRAGMVKLSRSEVTIPGGILFIDITVFHLGSSAMSFGPTIASLSAFAMSKTLLEDRGVTVSCKAICTSASNSVQPVQDLCAASKEG